MRSQCERCGAPAPRTHEPCRYCGSVVLPEPVEQRVVNVGGVAVCPCGVQASWRCEFCGTSVCRQHSNTWWPGQGAARLAPDTQNIWQWAISQDVLGPAPGGQLRTVPLCTVCRAEEADHAVTVWNSFADKDSLRRRLAAIQAGIVAPIVLDLSPADFLANAVSLLRELNWPTEDMNIAGTYDGKRSQIYRSIPVYRLSPGYPEKHYLRITEDGSVVEPTDTVVRRHRKTTEWKYRVLRPEQIADWRSVGIADGRRVLWLLAGATKPDRSGPPDAAPPLDRFHFPLVHQLRSQPI